jgi:formate dehydrogenase subunit gamma
MVTAPTSTTTDEELPPLIAHLVNETGGPVTALRMLQDRRGWIDDEAMAAVAHVFNLSRAEVRGLVAFYADFRTRPPARHTLRICQAEACQAAGSRALTRTVCERVQAKLGEQNADGSVGVEPVYCLGLCPRGPAMTVDGRLVVEADRFIDRVLDELGP